MTRREWDQRARTRVFRISTLVSVAIVVVLIMVPEIYGVGDRPTRTVGLVGESTAQLPALLRATGDQLDMTVKTRAFADEAAGRVALSFSDNTLAPQTTPSTLGWIVFWFILGYAFYSVLYATAGSLVSRQEETQSLQLPMTGLLFVAYILAFVATESPDGAAALIGSLFPATAPTVMIVRIAHGGVPWWQIVLSVVLTLVAIYGLVQAAGRIYAGSVLRFGGRVRLREAWRGAEA